MTFLCIVKNDDCKQPSNSQIKDISRNKGRGKPHSVKSNVACVEVGNTNIGTNVILPTFTGVIGNREIRCLKDSGCQPNFIRESIAVQENLPIVSQDHKIIVNGFNNSQTYFSNIVTLELRLGNNVHTIEAICIPDINTDLYLPNLGKCVEYFVNKGYCLADRSLNKNSDTISKLDFILGSSNFSILTENEIS